jgi:arginyl-tRNA synthetase
VKKLIINLIKNACHKISIDLNENEIQIDRPKSLEHGDYSSNIALQISKRLKKNPREVADILINEMDYQTYFEKLELAGPGFINFFLNSSGKASQLNDVFDLKEDFGKNKTGNNQTLQVEFVSANPTGPLHIGHGRGAAIGDCLARIFQANGWDVTREFYYNDAGAQINNLTLSVQARLKNIDPDHEDFPQDGYRGDYIQDIATAYSQKKSLSSELEEVVASGNVEDLKNIQQFSVAFLRNEQNQDLANFRTFFDVFTLESSFYVNQDIENVVKTIKQNGFTYESDDALWLKTTEFNDDKDRVMQKSDGTYTYFVPDVAYHKNKWERGFKRVINEQGADHHSTITRVRAGLQALNMGIPQDWPEYVLHQMVTVMKNGQEVKISKRAGSYVTLSDLVNQVGCDATRFFLVSRKADSQLIFDIDLAQSKSNDNPVYYIQYAHARIFAVLDQAKFKSSNISECLIELLSSNHESQLMKKISEFPDIVFLSGEEKSPHYIATYLKELAGDFHSYYNDSKFLVDDVNLQSARLSLVFAVKQVIKNGLELLGLSAPEKM